VVGYALCVGDVLIVDEDFGHGELRNRCHAALFLYIHCTPETASIVECVEETHDNIAAHSFLDTLESGTATEELLQPVRPLAQGC
jgi:hypothetical protein